MYLFFLKEVNLLKKLEYFMHFANMWGNWDKIFEKGLFKKIYTNYT